MRDHGLESIWPLLLLMCLVRQFYNSENLAPILGKKNEQDVCLNVFLEIRHNITVNPLNVFYCLLVHKI